MPESGININMYQHIENIIKLVVSRLKSRKAENLLCIWHQAII